MAHHCKTHEKALPAPGSRGVGLGQSPDTHQPPRQTLTVHTTSGNGVHALDDTCSPFLDQVSDFHWWFLERPQTSMAASSREPFSFNQADSTPRISVGPICSISIGTSSGGNCSCSSHRVYLEGWLELASSSWATKLTGFGCRVRTCLSSQGCEQGSHTLSCGAVWRTLLWKWLSRYWLHCWNSIEYAV